MRFATVAFVSLLTLLSCGSGSKPGIPQAEACNQASQAVCAKLFSCTDQILVTAQQLFGGTPASCEAMIQQRYCGPFMCMPSEYHADRAQQCKDEFATLDCATLSSAVVAGIFGPGGAQGGLSAVLATAPACTQVCPASDAGSGGG